MNENKLYTVYKGKGDSNGGMIRVRPTEYLLELQPHEAINELRAHVQAIAAQVEDQTKHDLNGQGQVEKLQDLVFELEVAQGYLAQVFKAWQARQ
jgi:hypothetical protein